MTAKRVDAGGVAPPIERVLGDRVARLREQRRMTLERLAQLTGFTKGYLSKIENSRKVPPIGSLARIASALGVDLAYFFESKPIRNDGNVSLVRAGERMPVVRGGTAFGYDYASLAQQLRHKSMEPFYFSFPRSTGKGVRFQHDGEEFLFVLSGKVEFDVGDDRYLLDEGDSLYFDANLPHKGRAVGRAAKALVVTYSRKRRTGRAR